MSMTGSVTYASTSYSGKSTMDMAGGPHGNMHRARIRRQAAGRPQEISASASRPARPDGHYIWRNRWSVGTADA